MATPSSTAPVLPVTLEVFPGERIVASRFCLDSNNQLQMCEDKSEMEGTLHNVASQCFKAFSAHDVVPLINVWPISQEREV